MQRYREYETIYIVRPDVSDVDADRVIDRVRRAIGEHSGKVISIDNWGKRKLAYEIGRNQKGIYLHWRYVGDNECVAEVERNLRMLEPVLRFLTVKLKDHVDPEGVTELDESKIPYRANESVAMPPIEAPSEPASSKGRSFFADTEDSDDSDDEDEGSDDSDDEDDEDDEDDDDE